MEKQTLPAYFSRRNVAIAFIVIIVVALALWADLPKGAEETGSTTSDSTRVRRGDLVLTATGEGVLEQVSIPMGFIVSGTLTDIAQPGETVQAGDILAQLDSRQAELNLQSAQAKWQELLATTNASSLLADQITSESLLEEAQQNYDEVVNGPDVDLYEALLARAVGDYWDAVTAWNDARNLTSKVSGERIDRLYDLMLKAEEGIADAQEDLEWAINYQADPTAVLRAEANLAKAENAFATKTILAQSLADGMFTFSLENQSELPELQAIQAIWNKLDQAQMLFGNTLLLAPFDSAVTQVNAQIGEQVNAYQSVLTLVAQGPLTVRFALDESDLQNLAIGNQLNLTLMAYPDLGLVGEVTLIAPIVDEKTAQVTVWGEILPNDQIVTILPGMNVDVEVILAEARDTLLLPQQAIHFRENGTSFVYRIAANGTLEETTVTLGLKDFANVEILSGLQEGDQVSTTTGN